MIGAHDGGSGKAGPDDAFAELLAGMFDFWSSAAAAFAGMQPQGRSGAQGPAPGRAAAADPARALAAFSLLSRVQLTAARSALRYGRSLAQAHAGRQSGLLRLMAARGPLSDLPEEERQALIEDLRAYLREIGEIASREARLFQAELDKLGADFAPTPEDSAAPDEYRRRWKHKP